MTEILLYNPITVTLASYLLVAVLLTLASQPLRIQMVMLGNELLAGDMDDHSRARIVHLLNNSMSMRIAALLPVAVVATSFDHLLDGDQPEDLTELDVDPRFHQLVWRYFASILACNPLFAVLTVALMPIGFAIHVYCRPGSWRGLKLLWRAVSEPVFRAASC